jgi:fructose-1-phosphate kinase PfkB-like protein
VKVIADLHRDLLDPVLRAGISVLKTSDEELGVAHGGIPEVEQTVESLVAGDATDVVVTRASEPTVARWGGRWYVVEPPRLDVVDERGGGDATTAALAVGVARRWDAEQVLRLAAAAGAASVARRGLASANADAVETLIPHARVEPLERSGRR